MFKKRNISVYDDFRTGFFCKLFFILGLICLIIVLIETFIHIVGLSENNLGMIFAFCIIFFGIGGISFFFRCQFAKLARIADEIENENIEEIEDL